MHTAIRCGADEDIVRLLVRKTREVDALDVLNDKRQTALDKALKADNVKAIMLLRKHGATHDIAAEALLFGKDKTGTWLHAAAHSNNVAFIRAIGNENAELLDKVDDKGRERRCNTRYIFTSSPP